MSSYNNLASLAALAGLQPTPSPQPIKREVFISSFHDGNEQEVNHFIYKWANVEGVFTPKALGAFHNDDFIDSNNPEYVMSEIRRKYLGNASVTIVLVGRCTHSRRYVDWEIKSSLRCGENTPNGLLAYVLPSAMPPAHDLYGQPIEYTQRAWPALPPRLAANWNYFDQQNCYARYYVPPTSADELRHHIDLAVWDRTHRDHLIKNSSDMMQNNAKCLVCDVWH